MNHRMIACCVTSLLALAGCYSPGEDLDAASIGAALEEENGGLSMEDEAPAFGLDAELASLELLDEDPAIEDAMASEPEVATMTSMPSVVRYRVAVIWGQIPGDRENETPRDWTGVLAVNRGALLVHRPLAFEPDTDRLLERRDPRHVPFASMTLPHFDGLALEVVDPDPGAEAPLGIGYIAGLRAPLPTDAEPVRITIRELLDGPVELVTDEAGNRMIAVAHVVPPVDRCAHGFLMGRWDRVEEGRGRFVGRVVDERGGLRGHVRGIYGVRASGEQVFFGKYIGVDGAFLGIFRGHYADGSFEGRWMTRSGDTGGLGGHYRESAGPETGGGFIGRWAETSCEPPPPPPPPAPPAS